MDEAGVKVIASPVGPLWLGGTTQGVCAVAFGERPDMAEVSDAGLKHMVRYGVTFVDIDALQPEVLSLLDEAAEQLMAYFDGHRKVFDLPLDLRGTPFQRDVWETLLHIPYGETETYGEVAQAIGRPGAARAVGRAVGANPIAVIVPCHRVVGRDGSLTGYGGGLDKKVALLKLEGMTEVG
jgi:epoxyqueuosine reductase